MHNKHQRIPRPWALQNRAYWKINIQLIVSVLTLNILVKPGKHLRPRFSDLVKSWPCLVRVKTHSHTCYEFLGLNLKLPHFELGALSRPTHPYILHNWAYTFFKQVIMPWSQQSEIAHADSNFFAVALPQNFYDPDRLMASQTFFCSPRDGSKWVQPSRSFLLFWIFMCM